MGELLERSKLGRLVYGAGLFENYKNNSLYFYNKYTQSDKNVTSVRINEMKPGGFYFLHYKDDSNWLKYSPIFSVPSPETTKSEFIFGINFNFLPIEVRIAIFDKFIVEEDFEKDKLLDVNFTGAYNELRSFGFEYSILEYNPSQIVLAHKISMENVPRFLYSGHPQNKYDPKKLYEICLAKINKSEDRHSEMSKYYLKEVLDVKKDFDEKVVELKNHAQRLRSSIEKYG